MRNPAPGRSPKNSCSLPLNFFEPFGGLSPQGPGVPFEEAHHATKMLQFLGADRSLLDCRYRPRSCRYAENRCCSLQCRFQSVRPSLSVRFAQPGRGVGQASETSCSSLCLSGTRNHNRPCGTGEKRFCVFTDCSGRTSDGRAPFQHCTGSLRCAEKTLIVKSPAERPFCFPHPGRYLSRPGQVFSLFSGELHVSIYLCLRC